MLALSLRFLRIHVIVDVSPSDFVQTFHYTYNCQLVIFTVILLSSLILRVFYNIHEFRFQVLNQLITLLLIVSLDYYDKFL